GRHVYVDAVVVERVDRHVEPRAVRLQVGQRDLRRLLHDVAELPGQHQAVIVTGALPGSVASAVVTFRSARASARSSWRPPASCVYSPATRCRASSATVTSSEVSPARSSSRGSRWSRAIATFSASV